MSSTSKSVTSGYKTQSMPVLFSGPVFLLVNHKGKTTKQEAINLTAIKVHEESGLL